MSGFCNIEIKNACLKSSFRQAFSSFNQTIKYPVHLLHPHGWHFGGERS